MRPSNGSKSAPASQGAIQEIHFTEGALVKQGDLLILIDPSLYAADVARAEGQAAAAKARLILTQSDFERGQQLTDSRTISQRDFDGRVNAYRYRSKACAW